MEKVEFVDQHALKLQLKSGDFCRSYGVQYTYLSGEKEHTIKFNLDISFVKTIVDRARIFKVERTSPVFLNNKVPDLVADQLAYECGKVFYPLLLEIDFDGQYIGVHNYTELISRWSETKKAVLEYFQGETTERYLELMEEAISTPERVSEIFKNELFYSVFFSAVYKSYGGEFKVEEQLSFPIAGRAAPVEFKTTQEAIPFLNEADYIEIHHHGIVTDKRSNADLLEEQSFPLEQLLNPNAAGATGNYTAKYVLDPSTRSIRSIVAKWTLEFNIPQETELKIFELIEDKEEEIKIITAENQQKGMTFLDGNASPKGRKVTDIFNFLWEK